MNNGNSRSLMQITRLTVLTVHFQLWITGTAHSLSFSAMFLIRWAATTAARLGVKSLARRLSCAGLLCGASRTSQDSSIGHKCRMARSKCHLPTLSLDPRTTLSRPSMSFTTISIPHFPRLCPSPWIKTTSRTFSVYSLVLFFRLWLSLRLLMYSVVQRDHRTSLHRRTYLALLRRSTFSTASASSSGRRLDWPYIIVTRVSTGSSTSSSTYTGRINGFKPSFHGANMMD